MKAKRIDGDSGSRTFVLVFDAGDEVAGTLMSYVQINDISSAHFTALGACSGVTLGYMEMEGRKYKPIPVREQVEITSLIGNITLDEKGDPKVHAHMTIARSDGSAMGGHLLEAHVRPTLEMFLVEHPVHLHREYQSEMGMALISLSE